MGAARSYVFRGNQIHTLISKTLADFENGEIDAASYAFTVIMFNYLLSDQTYSTDENRLRTAENVRQNLVQTGQIRIDEMPLSAELREIIMHPPASMFDPMRGERLSTYGPYLNSGLTID
jgi:hypothetical protein